MESSILEIKDEKQKETISYYMEPRLLKNLKDKIIPSLHKKDKDCVIAIDGKEGAGKSTLAFQIGKYVDPTLDLSRVVFNAEDFREAVFKAKKGQCIIYDEAFTGLSSRSSLSGINRALVGLMMQMRQKNLFVIIVLPTFFLLDKYVALFRTRFLIHVFESRGIRGYFRLYNSKKKKLLFLLGRQTYSYMTHKVRTRFKGRFYGKFALGGEEVEEKYRQQKDKALRDVETTPMTPGQVKFKEQRDILIWVLRKTTKMTYVQIENMLNDYNFGMAMKQIAGICVRFGDKEDKKAGKQRKTSADADSDSADDG